MKLRTSVLATLLAASLWLAACTPTQQAWFTEVDNLIVTGEPIATAILAVADPKLSPYATKINSDFTLVNTVVAAVVAKTGTMASVNAAVQTLDADTAQLEAALQIVNPASQARATALVNLIASLVADIEAQIPATTARWGVVATWAALGMGPLPQAPPGGWKVKAAPRHWNGKRYAKELKKIQKAAKGKK